MASSTKTILWILWIIGAVGGGAGVYNRFATGHLDANYGSYIVWGLWVSAYIYYIGLSAGAFLLSSLIYVFGVKRLERVGKMALLVALITLCMALLSILFDLGRMERAHRVMTSPNFSSMMGWMVWLYTAYFFLLIAELWFALRPDLAQWAARSDWRGTVGRLIARTNGPLTKAQEDDAHSWLRWLGTFGVPLAFTFHGGVGALLGTVAARSYWHTPLMPILFLVGALLSGGALMTFTIAAFWPNRDQVWRDTVQCLGKVVLGLICFDLLLEWAEISIPLWYSVGHEADLMHRVLFGEYWYVFWVFHILLGALIPMLLIIFRGRSPFAVGRAGLLVACTFLAVRLNMVVPGLVDPNLHELQTAFTDRRLVFHYLPSFFEWQVTLAMVVMGGAMFYLGYKFLPLTDERETA
jgi:molybdopterin-containing oxidoreductase family membrane subunit